MKTTLTALLVAASLVVAGCGSQNSDTQGDSLKGTITISGAWALYPMAVKWAEEFKKIHPHVRFDISAGGAGKGMADALSGAADIGLVSRDVYPAEREKGAVPIGVAKDAVIPVANADNPVIEKLLRTGITRKRFEDIWIKGALTDWSEVVAPATESVRPATAAINVYTRSDACGAAATWAKFLGYNQEDLNGTGVYGDPGIAEAVRRDTQGIGYNNINFAYDAHTKRPVKGLVIVPIDLDENGRIDEGEDFYRTRDEIVRAIVDGVYPSPPARPLYFVTKGAPESAATARFVQWVLTDGQQYIDEAGYVSLSDETLKNEQEKTRTW